MGPAIIGNMTMDPRPVTPAEIAVILAALRVGPELPIAASAIESVPNLRVVRRCACGCASVEFEAPEASTRPSILASALGETATGRTVFVDVWGRPDAVTGLEISDVEPARNELPILSSIRSLKDDPNYHHFGVQDAPT